MPNKSSFRFRMGALVVAIVASAGFASVSMAATQQLPGSDGTLTLSTTTIVLGETTEIQVAGSGFDDCEGDFQLRARINDQWQADDPGQVVASGAATVPASGDFETTLMIDAAFEGEWTGFITMHGGCYGDTGRGFDSIRLAFVTADPSLADIGVEVPESGESATAFLVPSVFIQSSPVPADRPDSSPAEEFHHISAWAGGELCATVDVAGGELTSEGDAVVWVGLPSQPEPCRQPGAAVTFRAWRTDVELLNSESAQPGLLLPIRPAFPAPHSSPGEITPQAPAAGSGVNPDAASPLTGGDGTASVAVGEQGSDSTATTSGMVVLGGLVVAAVLLAGVHLHRRGRRAS